MQAFFLAAAQGQRLCVVHAPVDGQACRGGVVYVHPLAEEMNRCRRMASLQARALAEAGFLVLQMDLRGCGDSSGDFADASWSDWLEDVDRARQWLAQRCDGPLWLWGARAGCLLVAHSAARTPDVPVHLLLWQPVLSGQQHVQQFLRLRQVSEALQEGATGAGDGAGVVSPQALLRRLEAGETVDVAGYAMAPDLARGLSQATLDQVGLARQIVALEVVAPTQVTPLVASPALGQQQQRWVAAGIPAVVVGVGGEPFWQNPEALICQDLIQATTAALTQPQPPWVART